MTQVILYPYQKNRCTFLFFEWYVFVLLINDNNFFQLTDLHILHFFWESLHFFEKVFNIYSLSQLSHHLYVQRWPKRHNHLSSFNLKSILQLSPVCSLSTLNRKLGFGYIPFAFCISWTILCLIMKLKWSWYYSSTVQYYILKAILRLHFSCNLV